MLLPPSVEEFIPSGHLARVISDVVETIDVKDIEARYSHLEQKSYFLRGCCCHQQTNLVNLHNKLEIPIHLFLFHKTLVKNIYTSPYVPIVPVLTLPARL